MPDGVPLSYASPTLRLALCLEDHPDTVHDFEVVGVDYEIDGKPLIHPAFRGQIKWIVLCHLNIPGMEPVVGFKEVSNTGKDKGFNMDPNFLVVCQTRALGRALKRAGYPDDMADFRALVLWRQRNKEVLAIGDGLVPTGYAGALPTSSAVVEKALEVAGATAADPDVDGDDQITDGEIVDERTPEELAMDRYVDLLDGLDGPVKQRFSAWARKTYDLKNVRKPTASQVALLIPIMESTDPVPWDDNDADPPAAPAVASEDQTVATTDEQDEADRLWREQAGSPA